MMLNAAFGSIDITPPIGLPMDGYIARKGVADGVLDQLQARCLSIEMSEQLVLIIALEATGSKAVFYPLFAKAHKRRTRMSSAQHNDSGYSHPFRPQRIPGFRFRL